MTSEEKQRITSNDYADLITEYTRNDEFIRTINSNPLNIIDEKYGVFYIPLTQTTVTIYTENGYAVIPKLYGLLDTANLDALGVGRVQSVPQLALFGEGVLLGFVDTGIDYTNSIFKNSDNTTRIVSIWDQSIENPDAGENIFYYGTEYTREQINEALAASDPFSVVPSRDEIGHGTMMAGIAGGSRDEANNFQGVVPWSEFVVVKLKQAKQNLKEYFNIPLDVDCYQQNDIMFGIRYLVNVSVALNRPIAICIGLGTNQGSHDGNDTLSDFINRIGNFVGRAIVAAAGNEGSSNKHYYGTIDETLGYSEVELVVGPDEQGFAMELWGYAPFTYSIDILSPSGQYVPQIVGRLGENRRIEFLFENTVLYVDHLLIEAQTGDPFILMRFTNPAPGIWKFRVYARGGSNISFNIWLPMSGFISDRTYFINASPDTTIMSPGNGRLVSTITAYNPATQSIYINASRGYTSDGRVKPSVAAPGVNVMVPAPGNSYIQASGTSIAAAYAAGVSAMIFQWGIVNHNYETIGSLQMQRFLIRGAQRFQGIIYPNRIWGYGTLNVYNLFLSLSTNIE